METTQQTSKQYFRTLSIMHIALIIGLIFFSFVSIYLIMSGQQTNDLADLSTVFLYITSLFTVAGIFGSSIIYRNKLSKLKSSNDLNFKMTNFRSAMIFRYAFLESPAFFSIVAVILTGRLLFLVFTCLIIAYMIYLRPTMNSVISDLELDYKEIDILENPESIIAESSKMEGIRPQG